MAHVWVANQRRKTAIATYASAQMAEEGLDVYYFQLDASGPQPIDLSLTQQYGYRLLSSSEGASDAAVGRH